MIHSLECLHAAQFSHTSGCDATPSNTIHYHDASQPLPVSHNFELNESRGDLVSSPTSKSLLLDGRLHSTSSQAQEPQEQKRVLISGPAKQRARAPPPPPLKLTIPEHPRERSEWHIASRSPGLVDSTSATLIHSDYSGDGAGYFSPSQSPGPSPTTAPVPSSQASSIPFVKKARLRARSVANGDLPKLGAGKNRVLRKMVKERRSLQSLLMTSFLHSLQSQSTPLNSAGSRTEAHSASTQNVSSSAVLSSDATSAGAGNDARSETRRSFYSRRRSHTYSGRDNSITSPSLASSVTRMPPMPEQHSPTSSSPPTGRESPSSYLLDDDPFAVSPAMVVPLCNSPTHSPGYTPMHSPTHSFSHSPSTVSLSSADSPSMPGTPIFHSFSLGPEEREEPAPRSSVSTSTSTPPARQVPSPPPPTPSSPLNPNSTPGALLNERAKSKEQILHPLTTTLSATISPPPTSPSSASSSFSHASTLPQPPPTRARPAHTRPAFAPRPSLPSLSTLSRMGAAAGEFANSLRGRKRRGKVGASLPAEPWDLPTPEERIAEAQLEDSIQEHTAVEDHNVGCRGNIGEIDECEKPVTEISNDPSTSELSSWSELTHRVELAHEPFETSNNVPASEIDSAKDSLPPSNTQGVSPDDSEKFPVDVRVSDGDSDESGPMNLSPEKVEPKESESALEKTARNEGNGNVEGDTGNAHGEEEVSIDAERTYMTMPLPLSAAVEEMNGESVDISSMATATSDYLPLSEMHEGEYTMRTADQDVDQPRKDGKTLQGVFAGDEYDNDEDLRRLAASDAESETSVAKVGSCAIAIPSRASAIPRHVLRALTPYPFSTPRCESPSPSNSSWSPQSSIEDFGVLLSSSPAFRGDQRPDSLTLDPGLPGAFVGVYACNQEFPLGEDQLSSKDGTSPSLSSSIARLPSSVVCDPVTQGPSATEADSEFRCANDIAFASETEVTAESPAPNYATSLCSTLPSQESSSLSSPLASPSELDCPEHSVSCSPFREGALRFDSRPSSGNRSSSQYVEDQPGYYLDDYDHGAEHELYCEYTPEDEDNSSMLPPLSTLPEEDPVFTLSPSRSQERYEQAEYTSLASRSLSRKASVATMASIFSMRSGSSGCTSQISHSFSRNHSPAASLSSTLPISSSQTGSLVGRRVYGSSPAPVESTRGHAPTSSVSSLRSKSSLDLRSLANANGRRQGSQSSGISMLTHSSSRTKYDPNVDLHGYKKSSAEDLSSGLRTYAGNPYAAAVQAELEGKASRYEKPTTARYEDDELILDIQHEDVAPAVEAVISGWTAKAAGVDAFEPGSSAGTLRPSTEQQESVRLGSRSPSLAKMRIGQSNDPAAMAARGHASGYDYSSGRGGEGKDWGGTGGYGGGYGNDYCGQGNGSSGSDESRNHGGPPGAGRRGRGNNRDDEEDRYNRKPSASGPTTSSTESESESESGSDTELYGEQSPSVVQAVSMQPSSVRPRQALTQGQERPEVPIFSQLRKGRKGIFRPPTSGNKGHARAPEDDDVPLAQRIPGALQAQKSIRQQVKSEHERRRRERSTAPSTSTRTSRAPEGTISPPPQHVPGSGQNDRGRTLTARIPRSAPLGAIPMSSSQEAAMIAQRLMQPHHATHAVHRQRAKTLSGGDGVPPDVLTQRLLKVQARGQDTQVPVQRASAASAQAQTPALANVDSLADSALEMKRTGSQQRAPDSGGPARTLRPMRSLHGLSREQSSAAPAAISPMVPARRRSPSRARPATEADGASDGLMRNRSLKGTRTLADKSARRSEEEAHMFSAQHPHSQTHVAPPVPVLSRGPSPPAPVTRRTVTQTRIFINDMQHFNVVGAGLDTSAKDVLDMLRQQGDLRGEERSSINWMLYEICQDFGMERPVRTFELVADISGSWNKEKAVNCFMVKPSRFAQQLATIPSSIPTRSGFVDYESKKGKWNKRWLELREHGLWLSKREGKGDEFLCSLSAFDAYIVTRIHKAPRGFTFAVKSTEPIELFENKADYLHVFSVPEETGLAWVGAMWLARSYILYQEKNVLFRNKNAGEKNSAGAGASLARSVTRKKPPQAYVSIESTGPFEPGSLLAKRTAVA